MYLHKLKKPNGDIYLTIKEKYHVPNKGARERTVESLGYVSKLKEQYEDPIAYFTQIVKERTSQKDQESVSVMSIDHNKKMEPGTNKIRNVGYGILKQLYKDLELDKFWAWKIRGRNIKFSTDKICQICRLLVFSRALDPGPNRSTYLNRNFYFEPFDGFSPDDLYLALDIIAENQLELQKWIYDHSKAICERDLSVSYFDCTDYYFDIGRPDIDQFDDDGNPVDDEGTPASAKYRKCDPEKNHRPDPIIEMGLLMDRNGIPVAYDLFPGNESEKIDMRPIVHRIKEENENTRVIIVADRDLQPADHMYWINGDHKGDTINRYGYVYGQSVRRSDAECKEWVLKQDGYITDELTDHGETIYFKHKSRIHPKDIKVNVTKPCKKKAAIDQKQMVYYSAQYAKKQKADREAMAARARDLIAHSQKYDRVFAKGSSSYVLNIAFNKDTGEIAEESSMDLVLEKIREEEKYDGYCSIVTSELEMSDIEMRSVYRELARIEDSFKVTKAQLESRPVFLWTNEHIKAHFATCFMALVIVRLLEAKLNNKYPPGQLLRSLRNYTCTHVTANVWAFNYYDEIIRDCGTAFGMKLDRAYRTQQEIQRLLHY